MLLYHGAPAQHLEVEGKTKLTDMETVTSAAENVVRKADGTLAVMTISQTYSVGSDQINGAGNTVAVILQNGHERSAAKHCADLAYNGYDD